MYNHSFTFSYSCYKIFYSSLVFGSLTLCKFGPQMPFGTDLHPALVVHEYPVKPSLGNQSSELWTIQWLTSMWKGEVLHYAPAQLLLVSSIICTLLPYLHIHVLCTNCLYVDANNVVFLIGCNTNLLSSFYTYIWHKLQVGYLILVTIKCNF